MTIKVYEVIRSDPIGSGYSEIDARSLREAALIAATEEILETIRNGFRFDGFSITLESDNIARLNFRLFEGTEGETDPIFFEAIEEK